MATQQYMPDYPQVQPSPGARRPGGPGSQQNSYMGGYQPSTPMGIPTTNQPAYAGPPSGPNSYSPQPGFDQYSPSPPAGIGQLTPYNVAPQGGFAPQMPLAPDGTPLPVAQDGTLLPPARPRAYSHESQRSHHSSRSHRSSHSRMSQKEMRELERRPTWADSIFVLWDAVKGAFDRRRP